MDSLAFIELFARFRIWVDDNEALQQGPVSLDDRLKFSTIEGEVKRLLKLLSNSLDDLAEIISGQRAQQTWDANEVFSTKYDDNDSDSSESYHEIQSFEGDNYALNTESGQLRAILDSTVRSLLKLSPIIQKISRGAKFRNSIMKSHDAPFSAEDLSIIFPDAKNYELLEKLSKASNRRQQWLSSHQSCKLSKIPCLISYQAHTSKLNESSNKRSRSTKPVLSSNAPGYYTPPRMKISQMYFKPPFIGSPLRHYESPRRPSISYSLRRPLSLHSVPLIHYESFATSSDDSSDSSELTTRPREKSSSRFSPRIITSSRDVLDSSESITRTKKKDSSNCSPPPFTSLDYYCSPSPEAITRTRESFSYKSSRRIIAGSDDVSKSSKSYTRSRKSSSSISLPIFITSSDNSSDSSESFLRPKEKFLSKSARSLIPSDSLNTIQVEPRDTTEKLHLQSPYLAPGFFTAKLPDEVTLGRVFRCNLCKKRISVTTREAWIKHVHVDLSTYVCTFEYCVHPPFESRKQWFDHELDVHRREWMCFFCDAHWKTPKEVETHILHQHNSEIGKGELSAAIKTASLPVRQISILDCPLCDYQYEAPISKMSKFEKPGFVSLEKFRDHLGSHLEHLAFLALPRDYLAVLEDEDSYSFDHSHFPSFRYSMDSTSEDLSESENEIGKAVNDAINHTDFVTIGKGRKSSNRKKA